MRFNLATSLLLATAGVATASAPAQREQSASRYQADEIVDVRPVPIERLSRVTRADGNVFYVSEDNRWVITGDVIDMWTGQHEHELESYSRMRWGRTGTTIAEVIPEGWGHSEDPPEALLFLSRECRDCEEVSEMLRQELVAPAPFGPMDEWSEWGWIWCQEALGLDILTLWSQNAVENGIQTVECGNYERAARIAALAQVFDISPHQSTLIDREGRIWRGKKEIGSWVQEK